MVEPVAGEPGRGGRALALGTLVLLAFSVFAGALGADFVNWDDREYVLDNASLRQLDWGAIARRPVAGNFHPLTMLSLGVERALFGFDPFWFHLTNLLLHAANSVLVTLLLARLPGVGFFAAWLCGVLFAVHPLHVESVAWVSERKDVLSAFCYLLALLAYTHFLEGRGGRAYAASLVAAALALLAKPMAVTLPFALLLLDQAHGRPLRWLGKVPFLALAAAAGLGTLWAQEPADPSQVPVYQLDWAGRLALGGESLLFYAARTFAPVRLSAFYAWDEARLGVGLALLGVLVLATATALCLVPGPARRASRFGLLLFLLTLAPVLKIIPFGGLSRFNDRYMYLPSVGLFLVFVLPLRRAPLWSPARRTLALAGGAAALLLLASLAQARVAVWRDSEALWQDVLASYPRSSWARNALGMHYFREGELDRAVAHFEEAIRQRPDFGAPHSNLARLWTQRGEIGRARTHFERLAELQPDDFETRLRVGVFQVEHGDPARGLEHYRAALAIAPHHAELHHNMANAHYRMGERRQARRAWERALELDPDLALAHLGLGYLYESDADDARALAHLERARELGEPVDPKRLARLRRAVGRRGEGG